MSPYGTAVCVAASLAILASAAGGTLFPGGVFGAHGFGGIPWSVGSSIQPGDAYLYHVCERGMQGTSWGRLTADSEGCQNISLEFYGPFVDSGQAYWLVQVAGTHPALPDGTAQAMVTLRMSDGTVEPVRSNRALAGMLERTIFYTSAYGPTNLAPGSAWTAPYYPEMTAYGRSDGVFFAGYRDSQGRANMMSFLPDMPLPLSADMPERGFEFEVLGWQQ